MRKKEKTVHALKMFLSENIKGQDHVINEIAPVFVAGYKGLYPSNTPIGSFLFIGPTGTGKTEITKLCAQYLSDSSDHLIRFDMSEFGGDQGIPRLIGDVNCPRGVLGTRIGENSSGFLLFDEFEKASSDVLDLFLQILDAGRITLWDKTILNLNKFFIVCTSNIGSSRMKDMTNSSYSAKKQSILSSLECYLRPELIGRFGNIVVFNSLNYDVLKLICKCMVEKEIKRLREENGYSVRLTEEAILFLIRIGFDEKNGARPMRNAIIKSITNLLVEDEGRYKELYECNDQVDITADNYNLKLKFAESNRSDFHINFNLSKLLEIRERVVNA